jgi:hypothetical protein
MKNSGGNMLRTLVVTALLLTIVGCSAGLRSVSNSDKIIRVAVDAPARTQQVLIAETEAWFETNFTDSPDPILLKDPIQGVIMAQGQIPYPCSWLFCLTKGDWRVSFEMHVRVKEAKIETLFRNLQLISPASGGDIGMVSPVWSERDMNAIRPQLLELQRDLILHLRDSH